MITTIKSLPVLVLLTLASCKDYLDTIPSKGNNEMLTSSEQVEALFNNNSMFIQSVSVPVASSAYLSAIGGKIAYFWGT